MSQNKLENIYIFIDTHGNKLVSPSLENMHQFAFVFGKCSFERFEMTPKFGIVTLNGCPELVPGPSCGHQTTKASYLRLEPGGFGEKMPSERSWELSLCCALECNWENSHTESWEWRSTGRRHCQPGTCTWRRNKDDQRWCQEFRKSLCGNGQRFHCYYTIYLTNLIMIKRTQIREEGWIRRAPREDSEPGIECRTKRRQSIRDWGCTKRKGR